MRKKEGLIDTLYKEWAKSEPKVAVDHLKMKLAVASHKVRKCRKLTEAKAAKAAGLTRKQVVEIERNPWQIDLEEVFVYARSLGVDFVIELPDDIVS